MTKHDPTLILDAIDGQCPLDDEDERIAALLLLYRIRERNPLVYDEALTWCSEVVDYDAYDANEEVDRLERRVLRAASVRDRAEASAASITPTQTESDFLGVIRSHVGPLTGAEEGAAIARFRQGQAAFGVEPEVIEEGLGKVATWTGQSDTAGGYIFNTRDSAGVARQWHEEREGPTTVVGKGHWTPFAFEERLLKFVADTAHHGRPVHALMKPRLYDDLYGVPVFPAANGLMEKGRASLDDSGPTFTLFLG